MILSKKRRKRVRNFVLLHFVKFGFDLTEKYRIKIALCTLGVSVFLNRGCQAEVALVGPASPEASAP